MQNIPISFTHVSIGQKADFAKNLSIMLKSGLSLTESLSIISEQAGPSFKRVIDSINASVTSGNSLSSSLSAHPGVFPPFFVNTVDSGETGGSLEENLGHIARHLEKEKEFRENIRSAMFYPAIILVLSFFLGAGLAFVILPKITPIFLGLNIDLPAGTRFLIWLSGAIEAHRLEIIVAFCALLSLGPWLWRSKFARPFTHMLYLRLPLAGRLARQKNLAVFNRAMGTLLKSGITIDRSLAIAVKTVDNHYYKKIIRKIADGVSRGDKLSDSLGRHLSYFPKMETSLIRVGERSGNLEEEFLNLADIYEARIDSATKKLSSALEPVLLIIIGGIVAWLAISIILPIYKISGNVYRG